MTQMQPKRTLAILFGGRSGEHEVSLMSARSILSVLDRLSISTCHVYGHNGGATVAVELALNHPKRVVSLLLDAPVAVEALLEQRPVLQALFNDGVVVYLADGTPVAEFPASAGWMGASQGRLDAVAIALKDGRATVGQPFLDKQANAPVLAMTVPIRDQQGRVIGALAGMTRINDPGFLDRVGANSYGKTGGYVLVSPRQRRQRPRCRHATHRQSRSSARLHRLQRRLPADHRPDRRLAGRHPRRDPRHGRPNHPLAHDRHRP